MEEMGTRFQMHFIFVFVCFGGKFELGCLGIVFQWTMQAQPEETGITYSLGPKLYEVSRKEETVLCHSFL